MLTSTLADYLELIGIGIVGTNIFVEYLPATENNYDVAITSTGGLVSPDGLRVPYTVQIRTRSENPQTAYTTLMDIYDNIHGKTNFNLPDDTHVVSIYGLQSAPLNIGRDNNDKQEYTLNFTVNIVHTVMND